MKVKKNIFWGIFCILAAVALVANKLGYLQGIGFWSILFSVLLAGLCIIGILKQKWGQTMFSAAFLIIINDELLRLESLTPWTVLGVALLGTIGLHLLFPSKRQNRHPLIHKGNLTTSQWNESDESQITEDGEKIQQDVVFGNSVKYVKSQELSKINADCVFGQISTYLTEAALKNHRAKMNIDVVFGNAAIYVPANWTVVTRIDPVFGNVTFCGTCSENEENKLLINGDVVFGELVIYYV